MAEDRHARDAQKALRDIERVGSESEILGTSSLARRVEAEISAAGGPADDPAELWGRRIGRGLAALLFLVLVVYLARTYLLR